MDKLKIVLDSLKKYLFWTLSVAIVVVIVASWWMATMSLARQFQQQKKDIESRFSTVEGIAADSQHPTPEYTEKVTNKHKKLKEGVLSVWTTLYNEQKAKNPWPSVLGADFIALVNKPDFDGTFPDRYRERYQNIIKEYFPTLFKIVDVRHPSENAEGAKPAEPAAPAAMRPLGFLRPGGLGAAGRRSAADNVEMVGVVDWDEADQERLKERFNWEHTPDSLKILKAQEDLWVYETLLKVIRETNEGATDQSTANVKRIESIDIGSDAVKTWADADQSVFRVPTAEAAATHGGAAGAGGETRAAPGAVAGREAVPVDSKELLLKDRYVDDKGVPLAADAKPPYAEFKMMPVSMKLYMDQRKISKLLAECANRSMPIEVRRVRIRPGEGEILDLGSLAAANTQGAAMPGRGDFGRRAAGARMPGALGQTDYVEGDYGPYVIPVEIQGIIYIYNPPDLNTLGTGTVAEKTAEGTAAPAPGAEPGAAPATPDAAAKPQDANPATPAGK